MTQCLIFMASILIKDAREKVGEMMIAYIWAEAQNGVIGAQGQLPWHIPEDLHHFKQLTQNQILVMGYRTYQTMPKPPTFGRKYWVLTHHQDQDLPASVNFYQDAAHLKKQVLDRPQQAFMVIGGVSVFNLFKAQVTTLYQTKIHGDYAGDTYMPSLPWATFQLVAQKKNRKFVFNHYQRKY